jgi:carboxyl-terminal processing protease
VTTNALAGTPKTADPYRALDLFARIIHFVESNYVEDVDHQKLIYGAIRGMLSALDPHTAFLPPEMYRDIKIDTSGELEGLGLEVSVKDGALTVIAPIEGTPAHKAGVQPGDRILAIDGKPTRKMMLNEAVRAMRGPKGTKVKLRIRRAGERKPLELEMVRDRIRIQSASGALLEGGYAYLRLKTFQDRTDEHLVETLKKLEKENGAPLRGMLLDLRNNPGGLLDQAVRVADLFLEKGAIVVTKGRAGQQVETRTAREKTGGWSSHPMVVLVNGGSASASEIVAGALQDHKRAILLGTQTFGKGSVQTVVEMEDGNGKKVGLKLTVARYYTPSGRSIQERGITPDIVVEEGRVPAAREEARRREKDLDRHFKGEGGSVPAEAPARSQATQRLLADVQLKTALDHLKAYQIWKRLARPAP